MNTRFRPTPYGPPHLGHVLIAGLNYGHSIAHDGKFIVQVDDVFYERRGYWRSGWKLERAVEAHVDVLTWMGYPPDEVWYSSTNEELQREVCDAVGVTWPPDGIEQRFISNKSDLGGNILMGPSGALEAPTAAWYCAVRVADDYACKIGAFARGFDLVQEFCLYSWMWVKAFGTRPPAQSYFPILCRRGGNKEASTEGALSVIALRDAGYTPYQIQQSLTAIGWKAILECWNAYWIPEGYLTADEVRPIPLVTRDDAAAIRGGKASNVDDVWAAGDDFEHPGNDWLASDISEAMEKHVRADLIKQGFDPDPIVAAVKRGEEVYDWALANDIRPVLAA